VTTVAEMLALGRTYFQEGNLALAEQFCREILRAEPNYADAHHFLGAIAYETGHFDQAVASIRRSLTLNPGCVEAYYHLGMALECQDQLEEAIASQKQAIRLKPDFADAWNNLGFTLKRQGKVDDAIASYRQAILHRPSYVQAHNNLGVVLQEQGHLKEALASFDQALRLNPAFDSAHWNRSLLRLLLGDFDEGWPEYESRWTQPGNARRSFSQPLWNGSELRGKSILLHAEQALGDTIQFIRYAPLVKQRGGFVIVECQRSLMQLLAGANGVDRLLARGSALPEFDVHAPLASLPGIFHTTLSTIPNSTPYLDAGSRLKAKWREILDNTTAATAGRRTSDFLVGVAWQGNPAYGNDRYRSVPLSFFSCVAQVQRVRLISLQKGPGSEQLSRWQGSSAPISLGHHLDETAGAFMDTAAIMMNLDLVISSDTAIAHLAGALGVPVWVALPLVPDWRWLLQRADSPWYPAMRMFRQTRLWDWKEVFDRIADELRKLLT
jgi:tetratricopeptide (TPR) repeat protein